MTTTPASILIVDDEPQNCRLLEALLHPEGYVTRMATDGPLALASVAAQPPDLILLDVMMPGMDGFEVTRRLKADASTANIPVIMVSALIDRTARLAGLEAGAEEFLTKPIDRAELWLRVRNLLRLKAQVREQTTSLKEAERRLDQLAHYDSVTGLPNRTLFYATLEKTLAQAALAGWVVAVVGIDLDHFKNVNDTLGHAVGDELLGQFGRRLVQCVRIRDTVGRLGGDEFALILVYPRDAQGCVSVANKIREALKVPFELGGHEVSVTASIGITLYPDDASDAEALMRYADTAMYRAKEAGRDTFRFFTALMNTQVLAKLELEGALRRALENGEFVLHYQPKVQLDSGRIAGVEALLRWERPGHGLVSPRDFIPALEETGLIVQVGRWVIAEACRQIALWRRSEVGAVHIAVNVSGRQFVEGDLQAEVIEALERFEAPAELLELELTESSLMENPERAIGILQALRARGVHISIDDFGTGYSSLAYLRRFPIDKLKIDIAFIRDLTSSPDAAAIVLAIIRVAHSLKLDAVAEGVETEAQLNYLRRHRCDYIQGFYFSRPLPLTGIEQLLAQDKCLPPKEGTRATVKTVLLVDDDADVLFELQMLLHEDGYQILSALTPAEGFELLALNKVQVILCDQRMPTMSGTEFLGRAKELYPDTFRIVLSGYIEPLTIMNAINSGAIHRYYTKPWDTKTLSASIREAFRQYWLLHEGMGDTKPRMRPLPASQVPLALRIQGREPAR